MSGTVVAHNDWQARTEASADVLLNHWLDQVQLRLRRELAWCWYQRTGQGDPQLGVLPPADDALREGAHWSFNLPRRAWFFDSDTVAHQLSLRLAVDEPESTTSIESGSFGWVCERLQLQAAERFVLALALAHRLDSSLGPVCASCMNDLTRPYPTLSLAQRLWDEPNQIVSVASATHRLYRSGLLHWQGDVGLDWLQPLEPGRLVVATLLEPDSVLPNGLRVLVPEHEDRLPDVLLWQARLQLDGNAARLIPLSGNPNADFELWAARLAALTDRPVVAVAPSTLEDLGVMALGTWAWLRGVDLLLPVSDALPSGLPRDLPVRWYLPFGDDPTSMTFERDLATPPFEIPPVGFHRRRELLEKGLGQRGTEMAATVEECARRFRLPEHTVTRLARELSHQPGLTPELLVAACRAETGGELQQLTQRVVPRFTVDELVLPAEQRAQFDELRRAARALTEVHYRWGTARAWNEGGLAVLFHGPPGTGKTMAAEALAKDLDLEMYRIDLSQVISKYIGETEKNLRRIFDAADASDCVLFFDEADAIFGKRTEVKDAHDRYANIEISYLLERMERFKGVAILASNRRKDLDEAFLRRLRYSLAFPIPDVEQREAIWRAGFPPAVDTGDLDFRFLARQFAFSGGHIKSVIFNSCLQAAADPQGRPERGKVGRPSMGQVLLQVKRELQKLDRSTGAEQFGNYADRVAEGNGGTRT
jgi:vesicle-fusing ATPase